MGTKCDPNDRTERIYRMKALVLEAHNLLDIFKICDTQTQLVWRFSCRKEMWDHGGKAHDTNKKNLNCCRGITWSGSIPCKLERRWGEKVEVER